ncbi:MAG: hypothetical protein WDN29_06445 [Methylovirgula sp.]
MLLVIIAYLGGVLTILSPCILPVLPFVFARADEPFIKTGLPLLAGMALTFACGRDAGGARRRLGGARQRDWPRRRTRASCHFWRDIARSVDRRPADTSDRESRESTLAILDKRSEQRAENLLVVLARHRTAVCSGRLALGRFLASSSPARHCRAPMPKPSLLLLAYAAGAATSLAAALLIGGRVFAAMKRSLGAGEWIRRALGVAVLAGVAAIALGFDYGLSHPRLGGADQRA